MESQKPNRRDEGPDAELENPRRRKLIRKAAGLAVYVPPTIIALTFAETVRGSLGDPPPPPSGDGEGEEGDAAFFEAMTRMKKRDSRR